MAKKKKVIEKLLKKLQLDLQYFFRPNISSEFYPEPVSVLTNFCCARFSSSSKNSSYFWKTFVVVKGLYIYTPDRKNKYYMHII